MPDISKITLPSGNTYDIKDAVAREMISAGVSFIVAWDGASAPDAHNIPRGVEVTYNGTTVTGLLQTTSAVAGAFYLVKSKTSPSSETFDMYDEYVVIKPSSNIDTWYWEKIGDTKINLSDVVTDVSFNKQTKSVIGANSTFTITQPTVTLNTSSTSSTDAVGVLTDIDVSANSSTLTVLNSLGTPTTAKVLGTNATFTVTQPTVSLSTSSTTADGKVSLISEVTGNSTNVKATASGAKTAWNSKDATAAVTGYASPTTDTFVKTISSTTKKLVTASITGVSGSTTASKVTTGTAITAATGAGTASTNNTDWLKNVSVSDETLIIGAATLSTTSIPQYTFSNVTVPQAASATTVATGALADSDANGGSIISAVSAGSTSAALTGLGDPTTKSVIGASSTFTITQPTIALATGATAGTGVVSLLNGLTPTTTYVGATAADGNVTVDKDERTVVTSYSHPGTTTVNSVEAPCTVTKTVSYLTATASGANTAWNNKDAATALINTTTITVTKGQD